ncbi:hypothetical protein [Candidatus Liberibacter americanus]|uniref:Bbp19 family protein n=1 Tax=Candidatus Liberibacter americanus TaxID=309868 RepID=UPI001182C939|nr:hypothetical protein [Candidatus Liberibacter americanus]
MANLQMEDVDDLALRELFEKAEANKADYKCVFSSEEGQRVFKDLMREGGLLEVSASVDTNQLAFEAGKRYMVVYIARTFSLTPDDIIQSVFGNS